MTSAHMEIIERLSKKFDKVIVVPTNVNYYKNYKGHDRAMFSFTERYDTLVEKCKNLENVEINNVERDVVEGWRFIHTLKKLIISFLSFAYKPFSRSLPKLCRSVKTSF